MLKTTLLCAAALLVAPQPAWANPAAEPYRVSVWARVLFGPDGKAAEWAVVEADQYPAAFVFNVKARLARAAIPPPTTAQGQPAALRTGVEMYFMVTPTDTGGGTVRVAGISMSPLPIKQYYASYPKDLARSAGWQGSASAVCTVAVDGRCRDIDVTAAPGIPDSARRFMRASLEGWAFEPQQLDGQPIEGQYTLHVRLITQDDQPEDFRQDKFQRLLRDR